MFSLKDAGSAGAPRRAGLRAALGIPTYPRAPKRTGGFPVN
jgi:hypothetical protein